MKIRTVRDIDNIQQSLSDNGWYWVDNLSGPSLEDVLRRLAEETNVLFKSNNFVDLKPITQEEAKPRTLSYFTGRNAQPPHTDEAYIPSPARFIVLNCINPGEFQCSTEVWKVSLHPAKSELDRANLVTGWTAEGYQFPKFYCSIIDTWTNNWRVRFDRICMRPPQGVLCALSDVESILLRCSEKSIFVWTQGATLIVDNWRCLHRRGDGGNVATSRVLRRWALGGL